MKLKLADGLSLPLDTVTEKLCWLGRTGSGKTYGAMKLAELMLEAGAQVGALDPVGVWRALRVPAEKGGQSFEVVVFGGLYGDLPLEPHAGDLIADLVVDRGLSFVLDVSQFIPSEQQRFVRAFADRFFHRKKSAPSAHPGAVAREAIDQATGYKRSTRDRYIQFLQARKLVAANREGVVASAELFS